MLYIGVRKVRTRRPASMASGDISHLFWYFDSARTQKKIKWRPKRRTSCDTPPTFRTTPPTPPPPTHNGLNKGRWGRHLAWSSVQLYSIGYGIKGAQFSMKMWHFPISNIAKWHIVECITHRCWTTTTSKIANQDIYQTCLMCWRIEKIWNV